MLACLSVSVGLHEGLLDAAMPSDICTHICAAGFVASAYESCLHTLPMDTALFAAILESTYLDSRL